MKSQKELKNDFKSARTQMGIFQIRNLVNGKVLIDSSTNLESIWNRNRTELKFGSHRNDLLQNEWKQFGEENFVFEVLAEIKQKEDEVINYTAELKQLKALFLEERQPYGDRGYNQG